MSGGIKTEQRNVTRNQSTLDFQRKNIFTFANRYRNITFKNNTGAEKTFEDGLLLIRDAANPSDVIPAVVGSTLNQIVGILNLGGSKTFAIGETATTNMAISGDIDGGLVTLPATVTYDTVTGGITLKDRLTGLGFVINNVSEITKFDN